MGSFSGVDLVLKAAPRSPLGPPQLPAVLPPPPPDEHPEASGCPWAGPLLHMPYTVASSCMDHPSTCKEYQTCCNTPNMGLLYAHRMFGFCLSNNERNSVLKRRISVSNSIFIKPYFPV